MASPAYNILLAVVLYFSAVDCLEEKLTFWNLSAVKQWDAYLLPHDQQSEWRLGLGSFPGAINKKPKASFILSNDETSNVTLAYFSVVELMGSSSVKLESRSTLNLSDHSDLIGRDSSALTLAEYAVVSAQRSSIRPGVLSLGKSSILLLSQTKFNAYLSKFAIQDAAKFVAVEHSNVVFIPSSSFALGPGSSLSLKKTDFDIAGDVKIGERCTLNLQGFQLTMVGGKLNLDDSVELTAQSRSDLTIFGATLNFTEGSKIKFDVQSEFVAERNSSLIMARRDLRLTVQEKAALIVEQQSHCLMTDDIMLLRQTTLRLKSDSTTSSVRCFNSYEQLIDEKRRRFP